MLICPQCQFENPTANNFCQQCGVSLTQNTCAECGNLIPFDQLSCPKCGAAAGVLWWVIVSSTLASEEPSPNVLVGFNGYLDLQKRYQLLELSPFSTNLDEQQGKVLDCQPFQLSVLESLVIQTLQDSSKDATNFADSANQQRWVDAMEVLGIPTIAYPYISLNNQFYHALPAIHNAWQSDQHIILLLEDRSNYPSLTEVWQDTQNPMPMLQILQWFYEIVELWQAMEPWNCQQSLLVLDNLRVDAEDQILCLQRLYFNATDAAPPLWNLGQIWKSLFTETPQHLVPELSKLLMDIEDQTLSSTEAIQERIEAIAQTYQTPTTALQTPSQAVSTHRPDQQVSSFFPKQPLPASQGLGLKDDGDDTRLDSDEMPTVVLPMQLFSLEEIGRTDVGMQRDHNEDCFGIDTQVTKVETPSNKTLRVRNLYILCDGMGGHASGEVASALAVDTIRTYFKDKWQESAFPEQGTPQWFNVATLTEAVLMANKAIYSVNQENACSGSGRMGTTLVMVLICDTEVAVAHVGDSRLYRYTRNRGLEQVTVDHEVGQREIQRGVDPVIAYARPDAYQLTQAVGPRDENFVKPDVQFFELSEDTLLLLCSDGLTDNDLLEKHLDTHVQPLLSSQTNLEKGVSELINLANQYNGHDNVTTIAIRAKVRPCLEHLR